MTMIQSPIRKLVEPVTSWNPLRESDGAMFAYIDLSSVNQESKVIGGVRQVLCAEAPSRARQLVKFGDVLVSTVRPNLNGVARVPADMDGATASTGFCVLRAVQGKLDGGFLFHWVKSPAFIRDMVGKATGANYPAVSDRIICDSLIPLPAMAEQARIAAVLDAADELRAKRRQTLARLDDLACALFLHHFGDPDTIFKKWPKKSLGEILDFLTSGSRGWAQYYAETGDLFIRIQNVRRDQLDLADIAYVAAPNTAESKRTRVEPGDVLLSITADLGRTAVVPDDIGTAFISQHLSILRTKALVPRFLSAYLSSPAGQRQVFGRNRQAVKAGLNFDDIRSFTIPMPPPALQRRFAAEIAAVEVQKTQQRAHLAILDGLFTSLQDRAFSGKL